MPQDKLIIANVDARIAERLASETIKSDLGSIPYTGRPIKKENKWEVPVMVRYPRILFDEEKKKKQKVRFLDFGTVGTITVDGVGGQVIDRPRYFEVSRIINDKIKEVQLSVQKALAKVAATEFSTLPFPAHYHTPFVDIMSYILVKEQIDIKEEFLLLQDSQQEKYLRDTKLLQDIGLVRVENGVVVPGNILVEIETSSKTKKLTDPQKLSLCLAYFFENGYSYIDSIREVLGPHLLISANYYETALEYSENVPIGYETIANEFFQRYPEHRFIKLPRYLIQLESAGILTPISGQRQKYWKGNDRILEKMASEDEILNPLYSILKTTQYG